MGDKFLPNDEQEAEEQFRKMKFKKVPVSTDTSALWNRIQSDIREETSVRSIRSGRRNRLYWLSAAAAVLLLLAFFFLWPNGAERYQTPMAETLELRLPDQSVVNINADSRLEYNAKDWPEERKVQLQGEAFFQVEKGESFVVETRQGEVEVLGTAFNVYTRDNTFSVSCQEGRVAVRSTAGQEAILNPGDAAELVNGQWQINQANPDQMATWRRGVFSYESTSVAEILNEIERQYNVQIQFPANIAQEELTMRFEKSQSLEEALEPVVFPYRLSIKRNGQQIVLE